MVETGLDAFLRGMAWGLLTFFGLLLLSAIALALCNWRPTGNAVVKFFCLNAAFLVLSFVWAAMPADLTGQRVRELQIVAGEEEAFDFKRGVPIEECNERIEKATPAPEMIWGKYFALFGLVCFFMSRCSPEERRLLAKVLGTPTKSGPGTG